MNIGIICYASIGGSGIVATELGKMLAARGHHVHVLSSETPFRLGEYQPGLSFHRVEAPTYPLFREPQYLLALANKIVQVSRAERLDIIHAHYAVPHATAAYLARQILGAANGGKVPRVITTLHGTDITLVGLDRSYLPITKFSIEQSDGVTAISNYLRDRTLQEFEIRHPIRVIYNFVNCGHYRRRDDPELRAEFAEPDERILVHLSNFRPVKRIPDVIEIFDRVRKQVPSRLLMIGDGPDRPTAEWTAKRKGLRDRVIFLGKQDRVADKLGIADLMLLPSELESFGLAALEAMACEVPTVATRVGGVPEVVEHGETGYLAHVGDIDEMARCAIEILSDESRLRAMGRRAREVAEEKFSASKIIPLYEGFYREMIAAG